MICPDCERSKEPFDLCSPDSLYDDGECPYITIALLRSRIKELETLVTSLEQGKSEPTADLTAK